MSYGTGRPAILENDQSIKDCRFLLNHPMAIEDDMRLVSTVELIAIRERVHNTLTPFDGPVKPEHFEELHRADHDFRNWYTSWDAAFSQKYENAGLSDEFLCLILIIQNLQSLLPTKLTNSTSSRGAIPQRHSSERHQWTRRCTEYASHPKRTSYSFHPDRSPRIGHHT